MRLWRKEVFGNFRDIWKFSQSRLRKTIAISKESNQNSKTINIKKIFKFFPYWQTQFVISGNVYGGETDYSLERISMLNLDNLSQFIDIKNLSILELGPLEGGNTLKLCRMGARHVTAIEGRVENYLKCCAIKNLFEIDQAQFILDDVRNISKDKYGGFDAALVAGILYHLDYPDILLHRLSEMTDILLVATHYADETSPYPNAKIVELNTNYGTYRGKLYSEGFQTNINSGLQKTSFWPFEKDLIQMCKDVGFQHVTILKKNPVPTEKFKLIYIFAKK